MRRLPLLRVFHGPMCAGKSRRLLDAVAALPRDGVVVITHAADTRGGGGAVASRAAGSARVPADFVLDTLDGAPLPGGKVWAIDEAQFFGESLLRLWRRVVAPAPPFLLPPPSSIMVAGLDLDFTGRPFGSVLALAAEAAASGGPVEAHSLTARCACVPAGAGAPCGAPAAFTQRLGAASQLVLVGGSEAYQPACAAHHIPHAVPHEAWGALAAAAAAERGCTPPLDDGARAARSTAVGG